MMAEVKGEISSFPFHENRGGSGCDDTWQPLRLVLSESWYVNGGPLGVLSELIAAISNGNDRSSQDVT